MWLYRRQMVSFRVVRKTIVNYFHCWVGQQQLIKIMRNPNGQPLTPEGFKAIVKEVTGQDASKVIMGKVWHNKSTLSAKQQNSIYLFVLLTEYWNFQTEAICHFERYQQQQQHY